MDETETAESVKRKRQYLDAMGIQVWSLREPAPQPEPASSVAVELPGPVEAEPVVDIPVPGRPDVSGLDWTDLQAKVSGCTLCDLHLSRTQAVFGTGNRSADWLIIGEAPGHDEDEQGEPFVGRAGQLLNAMLLAIGLQREQVYIANILKCRPPQNRDPNAEEVLCCEAYLQRQIELIRPEIILAVGRIAAQNLLKVDIPIGKLRGVVHKEPSSGTPLIATYHPAYLLRSPSEKRKAWQDLQLAVRALEDSKP